MSIHPTALVEPGVVIGHNTAIWDNVHIRHSTRIGDHCIVGEKTHISYDVAIGNHVKINAMVYICTGVTIERGVMIAAGTVFTNDKFPRAATSDLSRLLPSAPDERTLPTIVREGATIGAQCTIGCNLTIGRFAMIGMGSVVTRDVLDYNLAVGNPARPVGYVCACGVPLPTNGIVDEVFRVSCENCEKRYEVHRQYVTELIPVAR